VWEMRVSCSLYQSMWRGFDSLSQLSSDLFQIVSTFMT